MIDYAKTREILKDVDNAHALITKKLKSQNRETAYSAEEIAHEYLNYELHMHFANKRWWKVVELNAGTFLLYSNVMDELVLVNQQTGEAHYNDDKELGCVNIHTAKTLPAKTFYFESRSQAINRILKNDFSAPIITPPVSIVC